MKRLAMVLLAIPVVWALLDGATTTYLFLAQPGATDTSPLLPYLYPVFGDYWAIPNTLVELGEVVVTYLCIFGLLRWATSLSEDNPQDLPGWAKAVIDYLPAASANWVTYLVGPAVLSNIARISSLGHPYLIGPP